MQKNYAAGLSAAEMDWILNPEKCCAAKKYVTRMLSNRYRNVTTICQEGEYKVINLITVGINLKILVDTLFR